MPVATPVAIPVAEPIVAFAIALLLHVPPLVAFVSVVVPVPHMAKCMVLPMTTVLCLWLSHIRC